MRRVPALLNEVEDGGLRRLACPGRRFGARNVLLCGLSFILAGLAAFASLPVDANYVPQILPAMVLLGVGGGLSFPSMTTLAMSGATADDAGLISGLVNTTAQVGGSLGLAVLATLSTARTQNLLAGGASPTVALTDGFHLAFSVGSGLIVLAIVVTATVLDRARAPLSPIEANARPSADGLLEDCAA